MMAWMRRLASTRLTLLGMVLLAIGAGLSYGNPADVTVWALAGPLLLLSFNLLAAILTQPRINRRPGLLIFHIGLLSICVLAAIGRLTFYEARVEVSQNSAFDVTSVDEVSQGIFHMGELQQVQFVQRDYTVEYRPGLVRGITRSNVQVGDGHGGWQPKVVGDDTPLIIDGYRFYTTFNKGFAAMLTWIPEQGEAITGTLHMPSYPLFDYQQANSWTPPGSIEEIKFWLRLDTGLDRDADWLLDVHNTEAVLVVNNGEQRVELQPGQATDLLGGQLRYEALSSWMGYKIFYDPTLMWLFIAAMLTVLGLCLHYWDKFKHQSMASDVVVDKQKQDLKMTNKAIKA